ncbi:type I restriction enzyme M protein [Curtobacterium sp. UNCCL20]|uniref:N-6 DNA methylase n=1 Tax=Curtobacterium sp. UNCCL20 TaxID=1502773 RepID=UPI00089029F2|nr:N-6 DNA methylase [Curtobacterium sp. UNCCL20]SDQ19031.1 type I restriction enzyme M protein [Curtobacterium sp. UNCCL20]
MELHEHEDGSNDVLIIGAGSQPIATGVALIDDPKGLKIRCRIRNRDLKYKPEEVIRQMTLNYLIDDLGYGADQISVEVPVQMGSTVHDKPADIVVYSESNKTDALIIVECKQPTRKDGIEQLKSYMNPTGALFGHWSNGIDEKFLLRSGANDFSRPIWRLPRAGETLEDIDEPLTRKSLEPVRDLYSVFRDMEQEILAHQSVETFNEIFKIVFAKLYDERVNLPNDDAVAQFCIGLQEPVSQAVTRVGSLFDKAKAKWKDVYGAGETLSLTDRNLAYCIQTLQQYHLMKSGDVLGVAFELMVNQEMKGEMGQYFTPRQVVQMMTDMINPSISETVLDPACGSGGFLIYPMRKVFEHINATWDDADDRAEQRKDYAQENLIGMDNDQRLVRVAKAYMIMENDGRGGIASVDSLDYAAWPSTLKSRIAGRQLSGSDLAPNALVKGTRRLPSDGVDVVLTNPPFAGAIKSATTLRQYDLAVVEGRASLKPQIVRANLFIERCLDVLKPGGRMGIVLPQGIFNNITDQDLRNFVDKRARILAVVGLHPYTFKPFTLAKTSVLFVKKWGVDEQPLDDYPIFTAVSMRPGKTKLGRPAFLEDGVTLDCDMDEIASEFRKFADANSLGF